MARHVQAPVCQPLSCVRGAPCVDSMHCRPVKCLRGCGAQMWYEDLQGHLLTCPARLLVCGIVSEEFERDVILAGQHGR